MSTAGRDADGDRIDFENLDGYGMSVPPRRTNLILTIAHGDVETPEEQESLDALHRALDGLWLRIVGGSDTTTWHLTITELPRDADAVLQAGRMTHTWWKVTVSHG